MRWPVLRRTVGRPRLAIFPSGEQCAHTATRVGRSDEVLLQALVRVAEHVWVWTQQLQQGRLKDPRRDRIAVDVTADVVRRAMVEATLDEYEALAFQQVLPAIRPPCF